MPLRKISGNFIFKKYLYIKNYYIPHVIVFESSGMISPRYYMCGLNTQWCSESPIFENKFSISSPYSIAYFFSCFLNLIKCSTMLLECIGWHLNLKFKIFYQHGLVWHIFVALLIKSFSVLVRKGTVCFWRQLIFFRPFGKKCLIKMYGWMTPGKTDFRNLKFGVWIQKSSSTEWSSHSQVKTTLYYYI